MKSDQFAALVKKQRAKTKLSQWDYGEKIGVSWLTIWRWENEDSMPKPDALDYWIKKVKES